MPGGDDWGSPERAAHNMLGANGFGEKAAKERFGKEQVSNATAQASSFFPIITGVLPSLSRAAIMLSSVSTSMEHDPFTLLYTF